MGAAHRPTILDPYAVSAIQTQARRLVQKAGFVPEDYYDIVQELTVHLLLRLDKYDPSRGKPTTFVDRVVRHKAADIIKARRSAGRKQGIKSESLPEKASLIQEPFERRVELSIDLLRTLAQLTPEQLDLCRRLLETPNISRIAADLGVPRSTLYESIYRLREIFEQAGVRAHLQR